MLKHAVELADAGKFQISIESQLPLEEVNATRDINRGGHTHGKIILKIDQ